MIWISKHRISFEVNQVILKYQGTVHMLYVLVRFYLTAYVRYVVQCMYRTQKLWYATFDKEIHQFVSWELYLKEQPKEKVTRNMVQYSICPRGYILKRLTLASTGKHNICQDKHQCLTLNILIKSLKIRYYWLMKCKLTCSREAMDTQKKFWSH
jgi:hypothetical protein